MYNELAPEVMKECWAFDKAAVAEGAIPVKHKELIAVGVVLTTQCIGIHNNSARKAGANDAELVEAGMVAASLRAGDTGHSPDSRSVQLSQRHISPNHSVRTGGLQRVLNS